MFDELPSSAHAFYNQILTESIVALKLNTHLDNFDAVRFNSGGVDRSKEFNGGERAYFFDWFFKVHEPLFAAYAHLADEGSKRLFLHLVAFRLAGHFGVKLPLEFQQRDAERAELEAAVRSTPSTIPGNLIAGLRHFDFEFQGNRYIVDCMGLEYYLVRRQYFFERAGVRIAPVAGDVVIDGGACSGDTAAVFSNAVGPSGKVFSFDPVADHLTIIEHNACQFPVANVEVMPYGIGDKEVDAEPIRLNGLGPGFSSRNNVVPLRSIDALVNSKKLPKMHYIKLDVEGAELESLRGARESIRRFRPKLAVSLYHKPNDLFELISYVATNFPFYRCYIDHYTIHMEETVLYCQA